ncbi:uncharacterized protein G2W53_020068 [Senna tora]|uniref:Uncharacterized protein n=1 Tax=Senna tora TaxID=362788 RepID=A0A834WS80_9FABA|nr:uncharacterized protein G2W53_020068 [Senna tora]
MAMTIDKMSRFGGDRREKKASTLPQAVIRNRQLRCR